MNHLFTEREKACELLEAAEAKVLRMATLSWHAKLAAQNSKSAKKLKNHDEESVEKDLDTILPAPTAEFLDELVPRAKRPRHRLGTLGLLWPKVDTIDWCKVTN